MCFKSSQRHYNLADKFNDWDKVDSRYKDSIYKLSAYDVLRGIDGGIVPKDNLTKVQAIALIDRVNSALKASYEYN